MITRQRVMVGVSTAMLVLTVGYVSFAQDLGSFSAARPPAQLAPPPPPVQNPPLAPPKSGPLQPPVQNPPPITPKPTPTPIPQPTPIAPPAINPPTLALSTFIDSTGQFTNINAGSSAVPQNPFFRPLGSNQRACVSCHRPDEGWSVTPAVLQAEFNATNGLDPIFATGDGANSPNAPVGTLAQRHAAYSMLLSKGLIRIGLPIPNGAQFTLTGVSDPYNFASASQLSLFRRPLATTNLTFLSTVMWDGRETIPGQSIYSDLLGQASDAVTTHEQGSPPSLTTLQQIVAFEGGNLTAQSFDNGAGLLNANGAFGGPVNLASQPFYIGINNQFGLNPTGTAFTPNAFDIYDSWLTSAKPSQASIARGERIFDTRPFNITGVPGFNDVIGKPNFQGSCSTCHNTPNVGDHSTAVFVDLGLADLVNRTPDLPIYTLRNSQTGAIRQTTDPGRALVTGQWTDISKFKVPTLRGLGSRAPYFHNGSAANVNAVINFYDQRFRIGFTAQERSDLAAFLNSL